MDFYTVFIKHLACYLTIVFTIAVAVRAMCPTDADKQAQACIEPLIFKSKPPPGGGQGAQEMVNENANAQVEAACRAGVFGKAADCIEKIRDQCEHETTNAAHFVRKQLPEQYRRGGEYLCKHLDKYTQHSECIGRQKNRTEICADQDYKNMNTLTAATRNLDARLAFQCIFFAKARKCSISHTTKACGQQAGNLVATLLFLSKPPACSGIQYNIPSQDPLTGDQEYSAATRVAALLISNILCAICVILVDTMT